MKADGFRKKNNLMDIIMNLWIWSWNIQPKIWN